MDMFQEAEAVIPDLYAYKIIGKITEGCSGDDKYKLEKDGKRYLLRTGNRDRLEERRREYERLRKYVGKNVNTHRPVVFRTAGDRFFSLVSWVEGTPVMEIIKGDLTGDYYQLGEKVGKELRKLHESSPADDCRTENSSDSGNAEEKTETRAPGGWSGVILKRTELFLKNHHRIPVWLACGQQAEEYLRSSQGLLPGRPQVLLHGDFHWNNCVWGSLIFRGMRREIPGMSSEVFCGLWNTVRALPTGRLTAIFFLIRLRMISGMYLSCIPHCTHWNI